MPFKERELLLKINEQVKKLTQPVSTTFAPGTGIVNLPPEFQPSVTPIPNLGSLQSPGQNLPTSQ